MAIAPQASTLVEGLGGTTRQFDYRHHRTGTIFALKGDPEPGPSKHKFSIYLNMEAMS
jgi:hypothetical protein